MKSQNTPWKVGYCIYHQICHHHNKWIEQTIALNRENKYKDYAYMYKYNHIIYNIKSTDECTQVLEWGMNTRQQHIMQDSPWYIFLLISCLYVVVLWKK